MKKIIAELMGEITAQVSGRGAGGMPSSPPPPKIEPLKDQFTSLPPDHPSLGLLVYASHSPNSTEIPPSIFLDEIPGYHSNCNIHFQSPLPLPLSHTHTHVFSKEHWCSAGQRRVHAHVLGQLLWWKWNCWCSGKQVSLLIVQLKKPVSIGG